MSVAQDSPSVRERREPGLGSQAVVLVLGLVVASGASWWAGGVLILPRVADGRDAGWVVLAYVLGALLMTMVLVAVLGVFLAVRGVVRLRLGRILSPWWGYGALAALTLALLVSYVAADPTDAVVYAAPMLATLALLVPVVPLARRAWLPRWAVLGLATLLVAGAVVLGAPLLGLGW
ncbi:hypothetical protein [Demequina mangrovi]|nr:hypothetical protein [Demequina mangrovi]